ncbi:hypothetical protein AB0K08_15435 [Citricoccus sp. NPDC055426]|uniref:AMIN-like domain-containing (lipo)protein n=1 Tax=Citricoccus sp. NPDC055426 TaxID=3155536 RepID=UPI0034216482
MRKPLAAAATFAVAVGLATGLSAAAPPPAAAAPYCGIYWGSLAKSNATMTSAQVTGVRTGRHTCYDRMVVDLRGDVKGYDVRYTSVHREGSGQYVPLWGAGDIRITVKSPAYNSSGQATYAPASWKNAKNVTGYRTFRQVAYAGSFEGQTTFGLGVRARLPFRVFVLDGPGNGSRLVVDVAHAW